LKVSSVDIVIIAYNSGNFLQKCVDALALQTLSTFSVVIVDNASTDDSIQTLRLPDDRFSLLEAYANIGFAAGNNLAIQRSKAEFIVLLNPDTVPRPGWLDALVEVAQANPSLGSVGSVQRRLSEPEVLDGIGDVWHLAGTAWRAREGVLRPDEVPDGEIFGPCAAAALYRREAFWAVGGFDERYFCYMEDVDLAFRLRLAGYGSMTAGRAVVLHAGSGITGRYSNFSLYHGHRNRIWTFLKNTPRSIFWLALPYHLIFNVLYGCIAIGRGHGRPVLRAYRDAWCGRRPFLEARKAMVRQMDSAEFIRLVAWAPWFSFGHQQRPT
jgi:GT2 family glycosyltransferase